MLHCKQSGRSGKTRVQDEMMKMRMRHFVQNFSRQTEKKKIKIQKQQQSNDTNTAVPKPQHDVN